MADNAPIVQSIASEAHVNPQLDPTITPPKEADKLKSNFKNFFAELDAIPTQPETPKEETPAPEPSPAEATPAAESSEEPPPPPPAETPPILPVPEPVSEIDSLEPHPNASPETKSDFRKLKDSAKSAFQTSKTFREKLGPVLRDLGFDLSEKPEEIAGALEQAGIKIRAMQTGAMTPETQRELEDLRKESRIFGILQSKEFADQYVKPMQEKYLSIIDEMSQHFEHPPEVVKANFTDPLKNNYKPSQLNTKWWSEAVQSMTKADDVTKQGILRDIADLRKLQETHDKKASEISTDTNSYQKWKEAEAQRNGQIYWDQVRDEVEKLFTSEKKHIAHWKPMTTDGIKDVKRIEEIQAHNALFEKRQARFVDTINAGTNPRQAARLALEFVELGEVRTALEDSVKAKESELKVAQEEIRKLREEVTKKRKVADAPLKPDVGSPSKGKPGADKSKLPAKVSEAFANWDPNATN